MREEEAGERPKEERRKENEGERNKRRQMTEINLVTV